MSTWYHHNAIRVSRRDFFKRVGIGLLATICGGSNPPLLFAAPLYPEQRSASLEPNTSASLIWTKAAFENCIGQNFTVHTRAFEGMLFKLLEVDNGINQVLRGPKRQRTKGAGECFLLTFEAPRNPALKQDTYSFEQTRLGKFSMFIVHGDTSPNGQLYIAVVNRVRA